MPCGYGYSIHSMTRTQFGDWTWTPTNTDRTFGKRREWIGKCASIFLAQLHCFNYIKANTSRYFIQVGTIWGPVKYVWGWGIGPIRLASPTCYYIGSFPNYWNVDNNRIVYAHDLMTPNSFPMENTPVIPTRYEGEMSAEQAMEKWMRGEGANEFIPDYIKNYLSDVEAEFGKENLNDYFDPDRIPTDDPRLKSDDWKKTMEAINKPIEDLSLFYKKPDLNNYIKQKWALDAMHAKFKACVAATWHEPTEPYTPRIPSPVEPPSMTAIPMDQITKPTPQTAPMPPPVLDIIINYGFKIQGQGESFVGNALQLILTIEEVLR